MSATRWLGSAGLLFALAVPAGAGAREVETVLAGGWAPFQKRVVFVMPDGFTSVCQDVALVPAGRRLVIEYASANVKVPFGQEATGEFRTKVGSDLVFHDVQLVAAPAASRFIAGQVVKLYADGGTAVSFCANRDSGVGDANVIANISGRIH